MTTQPQAIPITHDFLAEPIRLGEPDVCGALAVYPLFGPEPQTGYIAFSEAAGNGVEVKELDSGASVNDLLVLNPTGQNVLLYEGEEVLGAQQNRTFDVSVLVGAGTQLSVPVSCVEAGRWDGGRSDESFDPAPQAAYPRLRHMKNLQARAAAAGGLEARASQGEVWDEISAKSDRMGSESPTGAMHDIYETRRAQIAAFRDGVHLREGQTGALVCIAGRPTVIDHVSRPAVFARLHGPLLQGYALDALDDAPASSAAPAADAVEAFLDAVLGARVSERDGIGLGREVRFTDTNVGGAGLVTGTELVQLTAFAEGESGERPAVSPRRARINRPSRRRNA